MRRILYAGVGSVLLLAGRAEHGATAEFVQDMEALASERRALVADTELSFEWWRGEDGLAVVYDDSRGRHAISCEDGTAVEVGEGATEPSRELAKPAAGLGEERVGPASPDGQHRVEVTEDGQSLTLGDWTAAPGPGHVWDQSIRWAPDSQSFVALRVVDVPVREVTYVRSSPPDSLQPQTFRQEYPKPGDELRSVTPVVFRLDGERIEVDPERIRQPFSVTNFCWRDEHRLWFEWIARGFQKYHLLELDLRTASTRVLAAEEDEKFVFVYGNCGWWHLGDDRILWLSERGGTNQLYRIDTRRGETVALTRGPGLVRGVRHLEHGRALVEYAGHRAGEDPYFLHYAWLDCESGEWTPLTTEHGAHRLHFSPDLSHYVAEHSRPDLPPIYDLHRSRDGERIVRLARADPARRLAAADRHPMPVPFTAKDREGRYDIWGFLLFPPGYDPQQKYPVVEMIYAGPHGSFTPKHWRSWQGTMAEVAAHGFIVVKLDARGTNHRGRAFQQYAYQNLRDSGFPDRIAWMRAAAAEYPAMDLTRVGIYGGSAGGQSALAALLWHGDFYRAAAADCGCHDNRMDKIWWNEQWMGWPVGDRYARNSNVEAIDQLRGDLFLTVGEVDRNVDPSSTLQVVDALIRADKDFEFYLVPNAGHGVGERPDFRRRRIDFFQRTLKPNASQTRLQRR